MVEYRNMSRKRLTLYGHNIAQIQSSHFEKVGVYYSYLVGPWLINQVRINLIKQKLK